MAPSKKRKGAQKATSGVKKAKATGKKPRPAEALRTAFRKLIAGLEEVLAMLKEQNVIIANMTKETLKDILSRLLMGLEPPLSLSEVPETKIVEVALRRTFPDRMWSAQESPTNAIFKERNPLAPDLLECGAHGLPAESGFFCNQFDYNSAV
ncbi:hypothetical protein WJX82_004174 [Trebouxia sp. C0006]